MYEFLELLLHHIDLITVATDYDNFLVKVGVREINDKIWLKMAANNPTV